MSSSINGFSVASFRLLSQQFTKGLQGRAANRDDIRENTRPSGGTSTGANQRNLGRAERDFSLSLRGVERETTRAIDLLGGNADAAEKAQTLAKEFEQSMTARYETFVKNGGQDYMSFAEETAAARRDFRAQLRDLTRGATEPSTEPAGETQPRRGNDTVEIDGPRHHERGEHGNRGGRRDPAERAERDMNAIMNGLDRQTRRFERRLGNNAEAMEKYTAMRDTFAASVQKEYETFKSEGGNYMEFVERVAAMRQAFRSEVRSAFADLMPRRGDAPRTDEPAGEPTGETTTTGEGKINTDLGKPTDALLDVSGDIAEAPRTQAEPTVPPVANQVNLDRAKRDVDVLMSWLDRSAGKLMEAFGDTEKGKQVEESAAAFRSMVESKYKSFMESGGSGSYLDFIGEIASARQSLGRRFDSMAGSGFDGIG